MSLSLRHRTLIWIVTIHLLAFAVEVAILGERIVGTSKEVAAAVAGDLVGTVRSQIQPAGGLNAARILEWSGWEKLSDALLLDSNLARPGGGAVQPQGIALNPLGSSRRTAQFDYAVVYSAIEFAVRNGLAVEDVEGGRVVPIDTPEGVWGACWYKVDGDFHATRSLVTTFLIVFGVSTVLIASGLFFALRRDVLEPLSRLTAAARRVAAGDLSARVAAPRTEDEIAELTKSFNSMVGVVQGFNSKLESEVTAATAQARAAEHAAMTQRRLAATGELAAGIAHEINNPLGGLLNAVERLERDDLPREKRAQYLRLLAGGLERIRDTVGKLLRFTPRESHRAPLNIAAPALDAISLVRHRAQQAGVTLVVSDGLHSSDSDVLPAALRASFDALPTIQGETHEIGQAVLNLLVNALDALDTQPNGRIEVVLRPGGEGEVVLEVHDNGPGVGQAELGKVLDLFYTTKDVGKGTGLGLAIVHNVVVLHGGTLSLESAPGAGFHVRMHLPVESAERV